jgi:proteasome accessory factor B
MHPVERLLNLTALLLEASRPLTFTQIRERIPAYGQRDLNSAKRMFERDKELLRETGIPVELAPTDPFEVEEGYRIPKERYYLPDLDFTPEEMSALLVAAHTPSGEGEAELAALKLQAASAGPLNESGGGPVAAGPDLAGPRLLQVVEAVLGRRSITFGYRLSRVISEIADVGEGSLPPQDFDAREQVKAGPWGIGDPAGEVLVAFAPDVAWWAIRSVPNGRVEGVRDDGWVEVTVPAGQLDAMASWVLSFGPDAEAVAPPELRTAVAERLGATIAAL